MTESLKDTGSPGAIDYVAFEKTESFTNLQRRRRRFVIPLAVFFLVWYFAYVVAAAYLPDLMAQKVFGSINLGIVLGLGQFVTTFAITIWYVLFSNRVLDPLGADLRTELEQKAAA
jgi:uncharacterized membrane protein (DUF485 family)